MGLRLMEQGSLSQLDVDVLLNVVRHLVLRAALSLSRSSQHFSAVLAAHGLGHIAVVPRLLTAPELLHEFPIGCWSKRSSNEVSLSTATPNAVISWRRVEHSSPESNGYNMAREVSQAAGTVSLLSRAMRSPLGRMCGLQLHSLTSTSEQDSSDLPLGCRRIDCHSPDQYIHDLVQSWDADPGLWGTLRRLGFSVWQQHPDATHRAIFSALPLVPSLQELNLCDCANFSDSACKALAVSLRTLHHLSLLNLSCCSLSDVSVRAVASAVHVGPGLGALEALCLCGGKFGPRSSQILIEALTERALPSFRYLDIENWEGDGVDDACGKALVSMLECGGISSQALVSPCLLLGGHQLTRACSLQLEAAAELEDVRIRWHIAGFGDNDDSDNDSEDEDEDVDDDGDEDGDEDGDDIDGEQEGEDIEGVAEEGVAEEQED